VRALGLHYPVLTAVVVMGTANHYLTDCVPGTAVTLLGWATARWLERVRVRRRRGSLLVTGSGPVPQAEPAPAGR
jgi:uncharacterized membrane protein